MDKEYLYGIHSVLSLLQNRPEQALELIASRERHDDKLQQILDEAQRHQLSIQRVPRKTLDKLSQGHKHQGIIVRVRKPVEKNDDDLKGFLDRHETPFLLVLDGVQDPHNMGACLRSADAAGANAVIVPKKHSAPLSVAARRSAGGAAEYLPFFQVGNLVRCLRMLQERGIRVVGAAGQTQKNIYSLDLTGPLALVLGAEGKGLRHLTRETCDDIVNIPMYGKVESLNVSVAAGICLYEAVRQRNKP